MAEDLAQTALTKVWRHWPSIDDPDAYLWRTMTTTYTSWWRRRWNGEIPSDALPDRPDLRPDVDSSADLWQAMARLPRRQRAVIVLRYFVDLSEAQTADVLQCSVGTVKSQTSKALAHLRVDVSLQPDQPLRTGGDG